MTGVAPVSAQPVVQLPGRLVVSPSSTPDAVDVLNHTLKPRLVVELVTMRSLPAAGMQELVCEGVVHQVPDGDDGHVVAAFGEIFGDRLVDRSAAADDARRILRHDHENRHRAASAQAR